MTAPAFTVLVTDAGWTSTSVEAAVLATVGAGVVRAPAHDEETLLRHVDGADALLVGSARSVHRLAGQVLGVIGFGSVGRTVAQRATGLGMHPIVHDPALPEDAVRAGGAEPVGLAELAARADVVTLHVPLSEDTRGMIDAGFLAVMKPTAYLVNTARGALVDHDALAAALAGGRIAGAGLDTFAPEPLPAGHPLLASERVLLTPHVAFYSEESVDEVRRRAAGSVAAALSGSRPPDTVNPRAFDHPRWRL